MFCGGNIVRPPGPTACTDIIVAASDAVIGPPDSDKDKEWVCTLDSERLVGAPLLSGDSFVRHLRTDPIVVECQRIPTRRNLFSARPDGSVEPEAVALPPSVLVATLPADFQPGQAVLALGRHGPLEITPHSDERPGATIRYLVKPEPEFEIDLPANSTPGKPLRFAREDGTVICVTVPFFTEPGQTIQVSPPVLMVRVPDGVKSGDYVVFKSTETTWWRAKVPEQLKFGSFFAARMPDPNNALFYA